jgi:hypothetical protein
MQQDNPKPRFVNHAEHPIHIPRRETRLKQMSPTIASLYQTNKMLRNRALEQVRTMIAQYGFTLEEIEGN